MEVRVGDSTSAPKEGRRRSMAAGGDGAEEEEEVCAAERDGGATVMMVTLVAEQGVVCRFGDGCARTGAVVVAVFRLPSAFSSRLSIGIHQPSSRLVTVSLEFHPGLRTGNRQQRRRSMRLEGGT